MLISALIATRKRREWLARLLDSLARTATDPDRIQFILKFADDDKETAQAFEGHNNTKIVFSPHGNGYPELSRFVGEAADAADAPWSWCLDDDMWLEGNGWDEQLAQLSPVNCVAQPEFYHLGASQYGSGSCGPVGLIIPTATARTMPRTGVGPPDVIWDENTVAKGWTKHLLRGVTLCHEGRPR